MRRLVGCIAALSACGRINFDPVGGAANGDGAQGMGGDGAGGDGAGSSASGDTCATAIDVTINVTYSNGDIAGANNDYPSVCGGGTELVFRFTSPTGGLHLTDFMAAFPGVLSVDTVCPPANSCQGFSAGTMNQYQAVFAIGTNYLLVDRGAGGTGTTFSFTLH